MVCTLSEQNRAEFFKKGQTNKTKQIICTITFLLHLPICMQTTNKHPNITQENENKHRLLTRALSIEACSKIINKKERK